MKVAWVIDDDSEFAETVSLMLRAMNYSTRVFIYSQEPLHFLLDGYTPDLIVLDVNMPQVTGMEVLQMIRSRTKWNRVAIVMLSIESEPAVIDQALSAGADNYLLKPMTLSELEMAVNQAVEVRQEQ